MTELRMIPVEEIVPNPDQPRVEFDPAEIESLAQSIKEHGLVQPIAVEENDGHYVLIDGERRWRAVKSLGLALIRAEVRTYDEPPADKFSQAVVANLQRADLNPIEEALVFQKMQALGITQMTIARTVGKSTTHVNFRLKMLEFAPEIQELFAARKLPLDPNTVYNMFKLPEDVRVKMAVGFAAKGTTISGINRTITKYLNRCELPDVSLTGRRRSPASILSDAPDNDNRIAKLVGAASAMPGWELINEAAKETCDNCDLNDMASAQMCKDCPAVELLKRLNRIVNEQK